MGWYDKLNNRWLEKERVRQMQQQQAQQMMMQQMQAQQMYGYNGQSSGYNQGSHVTKKMLVDYMTQYLGANEVVMVDEFETPNTRHICNGSKVIQVLQKDTFVIPTDNGPVNAEVIWCPQCRKLIINRASIDLI